MTIRTICPLPVERFPFSNPGKRGYGIVYRQGSPNYCPGCGRSHWRNDIKMARGATEDALSSLKEMCARLGIASMYGCAVDGRAECPSSGVIDDAQREMGGLIEMLRELRGLSETVEARL